MQALTSISNSVLPSVSGSLGFSGNPIHAALFAILFLSMQRPVSSEGLYQRIEVQPETDLYGFIPAMGNSTVEARRCDLGDRILNVHDQFKIYDGPERESRIAAMLFHNGFDKAIKKWVAQIDAASIQAIQKDLMAEMEPLMQTVKGIQDLEKDQKYGEFIQI